MDSASRGIGALCATLAISLAFAAAPADASSTGSPDTNTNLSPGGGFDMAGQTFTVPAGSDDFLFKLTILGYGGTSPQSFSIYATSGFLPTGSALWTGPAVPVTISAEPVILRPNIPVTPGTMYAVAVPTGSGMSYLGSVSNPYPGGTLVNRGAGGGPWSGTTAIDMGFLAEFNEGKAETTTGVNCSPSTLPAHATTSCTVTVSNTATFTDTPTGTVTMNTPGGGIAQCTLAAGSCAIPVTMSSGAAPFQAIGEYGGDATHLASTSPAFDVTVTRRTTTTTVSCTPATFKVGTSSTCTATVTDTQAEGIPPNLTSTNVGWTGPGLSSNLCLLSQSVPRIGTCSVQITPANAGSQSATADVAQNTDFATSSGTSPVDVIKRSSTVTLTCTPAAPLGGQASTCTSKVEDLDPGNQTLPTGTVNLTRSGNGNLGAPSCTLGANGICSVAYTPGGVGTNTVTATYAGDPTHDGGADDASVSGSSTSLPPSNPISAAVNPVDPCIGITAKLNRLDKKLKRQEAGAGDSAKKARKRAKIRRNIKKTNRRMAATGC